MIFSFLSTKRKGGKKVARTRVII